jgi:hypothetical protein
MIIKTNSQLIGAIDILSIVHQQILFSSKDPEKISISIQALKTYSETINQFNNSTKEI